MDSAFLSQRLKELRKKHGLTQQNLGNYLNISQQGYHCYESGRRIPDFNTLNHLAHLYNLTIDDLLNPDPKNSKVSDRVEEEPPFTEKLTPLSHQEQTLLNLFSQLSPEDKQDFMELLSIKFRRKKINQKK